MRQKKTDRYAEVFTRCARESSIAFVPFAVAGDWNAKVSESIFKTYLDNGADILEIGYPFSDPIADGPVNQRAAIRSIAAGLTHTSFFSLIATLRTYNTAVPFGVLLYANTMHHLGYKTFCQRAADAGIDSILAADMPPEAGGEFLAAAQATGIKPVFIVSELTPPQRMHYLCSLSQGFVYVVSRLGSTGVGSDFSSSVSTTLAQLRKQTDTPLCVGFGLSTPDHVRMAAQAGAQGAIVGSALVSIIEEHRDNREIMLKKLGAASAAFKTAACS